MSTLSAIKVALKADATLVGIATGGIWDLDQAGRLGLNRSTTPAAFDQDGRMKPSVLLKVRSTRPEGLADGKYTTTREVLEVWFYEDAGYTSIETMRERVFALLQAKQLAGTFQVRWAGDVCGQRDTELDASVERSEYSVIGRKA